MLQLPLPFDSKPKRKPSKPSPMGKPHPDHPDFFHLPCHGACPGHTAKRRRSRTRTKRDVECRTRQVSILGYMTTGGPNRHPWGNYPNVNLGGTRYIRPWVKVVIRLMYVLSNRALIPKAPLPVGLWRKLKSLEAHILVLDNGCIQKRYKQVHSKLSLEWLQMFLAEHGVRL